MYTHNLSEEWHNIINGYNEKHEKINKHTTIHCAHIHYSSYPELVKKQQLSLPGILLEMR